LLFEEIGKLARILIGIVQGGETFSPEKASAAFTDAA
jgi:transposase